MTTHLPAPSPKTEPDEEAIRQRAYFLWLDRGSPHGGDWGFWLAAKAALLAELAQPGTAGRAGLRTDLEESHTIRQTVAQHSNDPAHRFHPAGTAHDGRLDVVAGEARQRVRGRRLGGSLRAMPKKPQ